MKQFSITRRIEIDAAHRVPDHKSKCFAVHGHRYVIEAKCAGTLIEEGEQQGMVMDFGFLKECMMNTIHKHCDHGIILFKNDPMLSGVTRVDPWWKIYQIDYVPTAENLAKVWYHELDEEITRFFAELPNSRRPILVDITVHETPNCKAVYPW